MHIDTILVHGGDAHKSVTGSISMPIYQTATFEHPELGKSTGYDYSRTQNPTREKLENSYAILESGKFGFAFTTGMAAISAIFDLFKAGDEFIVCDDLYGGSYRFFQEICKNRNQKFVYVDSSNVENIQKEINKNTKAIFIESPTNPMMKITDIKAVADLAKEKNILTIFDNTFLSPFFQRPLELGMDIVICSATKFIGGHNDTLAGLIAVKDSNLGEKIRFIQNTVGSGLAPFDSWLMLRGLKTLGLRMQRQEENANAIANWLLQHPLVEKVYYPGIKTHPGHETSKKQSTGFGAMISFELKEQKLVEQILKRVKIIAFAESLGGVESLITYPIVQTHAAIPKDILDKIGLTDRLLRLSVGIESKEDLIADLEQAMQ
ncbi:MAG TPA: PLP-dependent aspartate aminotransferase family protein [Leptospiraceae bacterium]|nr:PLP-dependent aspartate aminotransferase family protein [Leptospiraceae bacterium]HMX32491.1 PLP-dependent aspartate aminotransferase family protein [Leptospiraceae bacterium]HMY30225.1 PLP-dependent aspartate aminotransferase family protein [Leptospiraceae bacterium]HMZ66932.1 PLP-dependent aspartate aminotransferase family protein [Leptospiraceae bacterium]HNA07196.1 PLP-dependent aspartate aminotransferase family protein [Leptospiraceae bacterium]